MKFSAFAVLSTLALAASAQGQVSSAVETPAGAAVDQGVAMTAGIDARTGKLRALTDAEIQALAAKAAADAAMPRMRTAAPSAWDRIPKTGAEAAKTLRVLPNGMSVAELPLSAMHSMTVELDPNGLPQLHAGEPGHAHATVEVTE